MRGERKVGQGQAKEVSGSSPPTEPLFLRGAFLYRVPAHQGEGHLSTSHPATPTAASRDCSRSFIHYAG